MSKWVAGRSWYGATFVVLLALLVAVACFARWRLDTVPVPGAGSPSSFSGDRALDTLRGVLGDETPHPVDSVANGEVRQRIVGVLSSLGYRVDIQKATSCRSTSHTCATVQNIIAVRAGAVADQAILLAAHYDSVPAGPGASDDGSGVAILIEIARLIKDERPGRNPVIFLFTDGEEPGLLGADAFASRHPLAKSVAAVINMEARGTSGQSMMFETTARSGRLIDAFGATSARPSANSLVAFVYTLLPNDTDLSVFRARGVQGVNFAYVDHLSYYHSPLDDLRHLDRGSLQQQGDNVYGLLKRLLDTDLGMEHATESGVYTDIFGFFTVHWSTRPGAIASGILLLIFAGVSIRLRSRRAFSLRSVASGFAGFFVALVTAAAVGFLLNYALSVMYQTGPAWHTGVASNRVFLWSAVLVSILFVQRLLAGKQDPLGRWVGTGLAWLLMSMVCAVGMPGISYVFLLPSLAVVLCAIAALLPVFASSDNRRYALLAVPTVIGYVVIFPAILLVEVLIGIGSLPGVIATAVLLGLAMTFVLPFVPPKQSSRRHAYAVRVGLAVMVISGVLCVRAPAYTAEQPQTLNILYAQGFQDDAVLATGGAYNPPSQAVLKAMGAKVTLRHVFPWSGTDFYAAPIASAKLPAPALTVLSETTLPGGRQVTARLNAAEGLTMIRLLIPKSAGLQSIVTDGQQLDYPARTGEPAWFTCRGESCRGRVITLTLKNAPVDALLVASSNQLPPVASTVAQGRDTTTSPRHDGDQSVVWAPVRL